MRHLRAILRPDRPERPGARVRRAAEIRRPAVGRNGTVGTVPFIILRSGVRYV
jgi:hypothetical protein